MEHLIARLQELTTELERVVARDVYGEQDEDFLAWELEFV